MAWAGTTSSAHRHRASARPYRHRDEALAATADVVELAFTSVTERGSEYVDWYNT